MEQLHSGMNQDSNPVYQPKGTTRFALNANIDDRDAQQGQILSDEGNSLCISFNGASLLGYSVIGSHRLSDNSKLLFLTDNTHSIIGIQTECTFELLINADCLGFKTTKRISVLSRVLNGCERVVYFTDTYNSYRSINIDSLDQYLLPGETISSANLSGTGWDCGLFKHFYDYEFPDLDLVQVNNSGGRLKYGVYSFTFRYIDNQGNATNWIPLSDLIPVTAGTQSSDINLEEWYTLQGDTNDDEFTTTNKSITIDVSNLDTRFNRFQLAVVEYVENIKVPTNYYILEQIAFTGTTYRYTYQGFNRVSHISATLNELTIPTVSIDTVHAHAQNAGRLFLSNVKEYERDWSEFQRAACKITSKWFTSAINNYNSLYQSKATKRYNYYFDSKSFMRDEIYAFGIVYVFKDGSQSPVFHIPGTAADNPDRLAALATFQANPHNRQNGGLLVDREILTVVAAPASQAALEVAEADVRHLGLTVGDTVERWKVFNTAIMETYTTPFLNGGTYSHTNASGMMAFWECDTSLYPETTDCNGDYIYDEDYYGNTLAGTPIRHHKFPDATLIEHAFASRQLSTVGPSQVYDSIDEITHSRLGITFDNISVPLAFASEVQGYYIVKVQRNELNSTIVDKGMFNNTTIGIIPAGVDTVLYNPAANTGFAHGTGLNQDNGKQGCLLSSISLQGRFSAADWVREAVKGDYIKFECIMHSHYPGAGWNKSYFTDIEKPYLDTTNRRINDSILVASNRRATGVGFQYDLYNNNWMNDVNFISYEDAITQLPVPAGGGNQYRQVWYVAIKKYYPNLMDNLNGLAYIKTHQNIIDSAVTTINLYGGDVFINNYLWAGYNALGVDDPVPIDLVNPINDNRFGIISINLMEEPINLALRHWGVEPYERHPELRYDTGGTLWFTIPLFYATAAMLDPDTDAVKRQWKALNPDYHVEPELSVFYPVGINHNWCDNCQGKKPNFIYYSDKSSAFDISDNYRVVRALNVENLFPEDGAITGLFVDKDRLFATTPNSVIFLPTKPQTLQGDGTTVYTGTGDVLSAPPKKLVSSDIGYAGVEDKFGINVNEFGTVLIDTMRGKIFLLGEGLEEISNHGLRGFLRDNLPFKLKAQIPELTEQNYYTHINGVGLLSVYDPKYRRLILHKRDYQCIGGVVEPLPAIPVANKIYYVVEDDGRIRWYRNGIEIFASNSTYFRNRSFTLSYSFANKCWVSFHSFMPDFMYNDSETFYTFIQGLSTNLQGIWEHNSSNLLQYYTTGFPHIIELVVTPNFQTGVYDDVDISARALSIAAEWVKQDKNIFFNKVWVYTDLQSSGLKTLLPDSETDMGRSVYNNSYSAGNVVCRNAEGYWRFQLPRDLVDTAYSGATATEQWINILGNFNLVNGYQGYIDKIPSGIISTTKLMQHVSRIRSQYAFVRLYFENQSGSRIMTDLINSNKRGSIR